MGIESDARDMLTDLMTDNPDRTVTVKIEGVSASGFVGTKPAVSVEYGQNGETGVTTGAVRMLSTAFPNQTVDGLRDKTILVDGGECQVTSVEDGATWVIRYRRVRKVAGL